MPLLRLFPPVEVTARAAELSKDHGRRVSDFEALVLEASLHDVEEREWSFSTASSGFSDTARSSSRTASSNLPSL